MKISNISFKNIHSLRGEHHIDFLSGPLAQSGLFAITGATGSGKSTLLDVITLALYNQVPRIGTISKAVIDGEGGIMTRNAQDCYAEVEYIVNGKTYRSHWSIERNRNNNLNDRKQEITEVATGNIIESGKSSVPNKNAELIGLSYDQFVKAMVLSQGQFSKLLQAKRDERNKLLEDITGAKDYRAIGVAVFQKYRTATDLYNVQDIRLKEIELIPEEDRKALIVEEAALSKAKISEKKALDVLKVEIDNKKGILKNEIIITENESLQKDLSAAIADFKTEEERLLKHSKYVVHGALISDFERKDKEHQETAEALALQQSNETKILNERTVLLAEASALLGKPVVPEHFSEALERLRKAVTQLKQEEHLATTQAKLHEDQIQKMLLEVNKDAKRIHFNREPAVFEALIPPVANKIELFLNKSEIDSEAELAEKEALLKSRLELVNTLKLELTAYLSELKTKNSKSLELKESKAAFTTYETKLKLLETELKLLQTEVDALTKAEETRKAQQSLEAHRNLLVDGEACPLCGAEEHPFANNTPIFDIQEAALKTKKELLSTKRDLKTATETNLDNERRKAKLLNQEIAASDELIKPKLLSIEKMCTALQVEIVQSLDEVETLKSQLLESSKTMEQLKRAFTLKAALENLKETTSLWTTSASLKAVKETERKKLYSGENIDAKVQSLTTTWTATHQNIKNTSELIAGLKKKTQQLVEERAQFQKDLDSILKQEGIEHVSQLKIFILSEAKAEEIRKKKKALDLKQERLKTEQESAQKEIESFKSRITTNETIEVLQSKFIKIDEAFGSLGEKIGSIKTKLEADKKAKARQGELLNTLKALKTEETLWKTMNTLIGDASGKRFSNFVQDLTLEQLIGYTNLRLKDLSDRYILDIPTAEEASKNDSLKVFDSHQGDARRSINTLSGGETFMVSLAMAFALSDLAAKNVKIESIFIDEGFGTLDPETLNQAITILEKMQNEGDKSIGIISHVEALKERISTQIRLEKMGSGYSTIEIV